MTYRPHRSHLPYAPLAGPANARRRRPLRRIAATVPTPVEPARREVPQVLVGIACGLPVALALWAGLFEAGKAIF